MSYLEQRIREEAQKKEALALVAHIVRERRHEAQELVPTRYLSCTFAPGVPGAGTCPVEEECAECGSGCLLFPEAES